MSKAPKTIYLQWIEEGHKENTWSDVRINDEDEVYIREDSIDVDVIVQGRLESIKTQMENIFPRYNHQKGYLNLSEEGELVNLKDVLKVLEENGL